MFKHIKTGMVYDIQKFCVHDGPGIRTTVFMKGCPLRCLWCHNPESQNIEKELFFCPEKCIGCGECEPVCKLGWPRDILSSGVCPEFSECLKCADVCQSGAITVVGRKMTVGKVMKEILKDRTFYNDSGGGVTVSGGEPLFQTEFVIELLKELKRNEVHSCVETSGYGDKDKIVNLARNVDLLLWDIKETDNVKFKEHTGGNLKVVIDNLRTVNEMGVDIFLRCILMNDVNLTAGHIKNIAKIFNELCNVKKVELMPYHPFGNAKRGKLARPKYEGASTPSVKVVLEAENYLMSKGIPVEIVN